MKIGNISFNCSELRGCTKEEFIQRYRGQLDGADINEAFELLQIELSKTGPAETKETIRTPKRK